MKRDQQPRFMLQYLWQASHLFRVQYRGSLPRAREPGLNSGEEVNMSDLKKSYSTPSDAPELQCILDKETARGWKKLRKTLGQVTRRLQLTWLPFGRRWGPTTTWS